MSEVPLQVWPSAQVASTPGAWAQAAIYFTKAAGMPTRMKISIVPPIEMKMKVAVCGNGQIRTCGNGQIRTEMVKLEHPFACAGEPSTYGAAPHRTE